MHFFLKEFLIDFWSLLNRMTWTYLVNRESSWFPFEWRLYRSRRILARKSFSSLSFFIQPLTVLYNCARKPRFRCQDFTVLKALKIGSFARRITFLEERNGSSPTIESIWCRSNLSLMGLSVWFSWTWVIRIFNKKIGCKTWTPLANHIENVPASWDLDFIAFPGSILLKFY